MTNVQTNPLAWTKLRSLFNLPSWMKVGESECMGNFENGNQFWHLYNELSRRCMAGGIWEFDPCNAMRPKNHSINCIAQQHSFKKNKKSCLMGAPLNCVLLRIVVLRLMEPSKSSSGSLCWHNFSALIPPLPTSTGQFTGQWCKNM